MYYSSKNKLGIRWLLLVFGVSCLILAADRGYYQIPLYFEPTKSVAIVMAKEEYRNKQKVGYHILYFFLTDKGGFSQTSFFGIGKNSWSDVDKNQFSKLKKLGTIDIIYFEKNPDINQPQSQTPELWTTAAFLSAAIFFGTFYFILSKMRKNQ